MRNTIVGTVIVAMALTAGSAAAAPTTADKCEASKNKIAGSYYACREKAEAAAISKGGMPDYSKCTTKFDEKWDGAETKAASDCPDNVLTAPMNAFIAGQAAAAALIISGTDNIPMCGDAEINVAGEQCDGAALGGATCTSLGHAPGTLACNGSCQFNTSGCGAATCGDGLINAVGEQCDGAALGGTTCASLGHAPGTLSCSGTCKFNTSACNATSCGDGVINAAGEQCDGAALGGATCASLGHTPGTLACNGSCDFDTSGCDTCPGYVYEGDCYVLGTANQSCDTVCAGIGMVYDSSTRYVTGSGGSDASCQAVLDGLAAPGSGLNLPSQACGAGLGCMVTGPTTRVRCLTPVTNSFIADTVIRRVCACR